MINKTTHKKSVLDYGVDEEKFWRAVDVQGDEACWNWMRGRNSTGYGLFSVRNTQEQWEKTGRTTNQVLAHRVALALVKAVMPYDYVIHSCDNRLCCNPSHLRVGTALDNHQDMCAKGRAAWQKTRPV